MTLHIQRLPDPSPLTTPIVLDARAALPPDPRLTDPRLLPEGPALLDHLVQAFPLLLRAADPACRDDRVLIAALAVQFGRLARRGVSGLDDVIRAAADWCAAAAAARGGDA